MFSFDDYEKKVAEFDARLRALERYLPLLQYHFAGQIAPPMPSLDELKKACENVAR